MIDTTWIMSPRPVVPWGLRKALNWVRLQPTMFPKTYILNSLISCSCLLSITGSIPFKHNTIAPLLLQVKEHYCDVPVYVMANGVQEDPARFKDSLRVYYLYNYINEALKGEPTDTSCCLDFGSGHLGAEYYQCVLSDRSFRWLNFWPSLAPVQLNH